MAFLAGSVREAPANLLMRQAGSSRRLALLDLSPEPPVLDGRIVSPALRAVARLFREGALQEADSVVVMGSQLWIRTGLAAGLTQVYADLLPTAEGGAVRLSADIRGDSKRGIPFLESLGFAVETHGEKGFPYLRQGLALPVEGRGAAIRTVLDGESADKTPGELTESLGRALRFLKATAAPVSPAASAETGPEAERIIRSLLADVAGELRTSRELAAQIQSFDPSPLHYATIGRVTLAGNGERSVEVSRRTLPDGRTLELEVLRDPRSGQLDYGRAVLEEPGRPARSLTPKGFSSLPLAR